ncbi:MAG: transposase [Methanospirillaceae archaeon]|nr:transposase [Methanospirillaceae archaeon]
MPSITNGSRILIPENIHLVYLPPYSPDLNLIEEIWKSIRRFIYTIFIRDLAHLKSVICEEFFDRVIGDSYIKG